LDVDIDMLHVLYVEHAKFDGRLPFLHSVWMLDSNDNQHERRSTTEVLIIDKC
jgi:hypothetical protein